MMFACLFQVEVCNAFGDPTKAKAWSKHTQSSDQDKQPAPVDTGSEKVREERSFGSLGHFSTKLF